MDKITTQKRHLSSRSHTQGVFEAVFTERFLSSVLIGPPLVQGHPTGCTGASETVRMPIALLPGQKFSCNCFNYNPIHLQSHNTLCGRFQQVATI